MLELPEASVAVQVTIVVPRGYDVLGWLLTTVTFPPHASVAVGAVSTTVLLALH